APARGGGTGRSPGGGWSAGRGSPAPKAYSWKSTRRSRPGRPPLPRPSHSSRSRPLLVLQSHAGEARQLQAEVHGQPVVAIAQIHARDTLDLVKAVVEACLVHPERSRRPLRVSAQVEEEIGRAACGLPISAPP